MEKIKYIKNEFIQVNQDKILVLDNPIEVTFINNGANEVTINGIYTLSNLVSIQTGLTRFDYKLNLKNNLNEVDTTVYHIRFLNPDPTSRKLTVIAKYWVNK